VDNVDKSVDKSQRLFCGFNLNTELGLKLSTDPVDNVDN